ncbi:MAG TPA: VIT domain-containing protein, partial [Candidatus Paceibacterota bacterium]|nr:VIT domain-containing protein [Candidatus Paceibacterota bacterium]
MPIPRPVPRPFTFAPLDVTFHRVEAKVRDQVATTWIDQEFYNPNDRQLEGTYIFPVPRGAQIDKFSMEVDGR